MVSKDRISDLNQKMKMMKIEMKMKKEDRNRAAASLSSSEKERSRNKAAFVSLTSVMEEEKKRGGAGVFSSAKPTAVRWGHSETVNPLPEDLLFEVLGRVERIKSLYQYKCVSKTWRSIIECPSFWEAYRSHHRGGILLSIARVIPDGNKMDPDNFHSVESSLENSSRGGVSPPVEVRFFYSPIVDKEPEPLQYPLQEGLWNGWRFAQFGGRPALYCCFRECLSINTLDDDQGDSWTSHAIPLPRSFVSHFGNAVGNLPTGQTLFLDSGSMRCLTVGHTVIESYDHQEKKIETFRVGCLDELLDARVRGVAVACLEEDVCRPLHVQLGGS